jgi:hypothetical protein
MHLEQIAIAVCGVTAVYLSQEAHPERRRWSSVFGMIGQPFWFYAAWKAEQWGIFALCFLYTFSWGRGLWTNWIAPLRAQRGKKAAIPPSWLPLELMPANTPVQLARFPAVAGDGIVYPYAMFSLPGADVARSRLVDATHFRLLPPVATGDANG